MHQEARRAPQRMYRLQKCIVRAPQRMRPVVRCLVCTRIEHGSSTFTSHSTPRPSSTLHKPHISVRSYVHGPIFVFCRLSREPTVDDAYRLRKFAAALAEMRSHRTGPTTALPKGRPNAPGERGRLPAGREAREDFLLQLLSQLESAESLAQATSALGGARLTVPPTAREDRASRPEGKVELSASFQRRCAALCRERTTELETVVTPETDSAPVDEDPKEKADSAALPSLRFRTAAFELFTVLESVKLDPAREDEDEDPAFLPPGKRGWKHAALCEEAAGWADMVREAGGAQDVPSAELPDFEVREARASCKP